MFWLAARVSTWTTQPPVAPVHALGACTMPLFCHIFFKIPGVPSIIFWCHAANSHYSTQLHMCHVQVEVLQTAHACSSECTLRVETDVTWCFICAVIKMSMLVQMVSKQTSLSFVMPHQRKLETHKKAVIDSVALLQQTSVSSVVGEYKQTELLALFRHAGQVLWGCATF